jgi:hypothetical protein
MSERAKMPPATLASGVVPSEMTTWRGGGWSRFYTD